MIFLRYCEFQYAPHGQPSAWSDLLAKSVFLEPNSAAVRAPVLDNFAATVTGERDPA